MNYKEYWWKCTKEVLTNEVFDAILFYFLMIGFFILFIGGAILLAFLGIKIIEFLIPIFGVVISFVILVVTIFGVFGIILLIFNYRHYKKYVKDDVK